MLVSQQGVFDEFLGKALAMTALQSPSTADGQPHTRPKTAVIVVHGMGEQRPMETLWGVVAALFTTDPDLGPPRARKVWSKPEDITGSFELRRVTTADAKLEGGQDKRVDFFEFYWAHLMTGNTIKGVTSWLFGLLFRDPRTVPSRLVGPWASGVVAYGIVALALLLAGLAKAKVSLPYPFDLPWVGVATAAFAAAYGVFATRWLAPVAGDAARYLSATPDNVAARQKIRDAGVDLLSKLHASGRYDRIVVIGHSLGSVVAYDVLNFAWGRLSTAALQATHGRNSAVRAAMRAVESAIEPSQGSKGAALEDARTAYRTAQRGYQDQLRRSGPPPVWLVTDLVTVGSPLSKADVLLARDPEGLRSKIERRELPTCPPEPDKPGAAEYQFSYRAGGEWVPHHAAVFGPVVWTNIWFPSKFLLFGDVISGPCAELLGPGIRDIEIPIGAPVFRHLDYWKDPDATPLPQWIAV